MDNLPGPGIDPMDPRPPEPPAVNPLVSLFGFVAMGVGTVTVRTNILAQQAGPPWWGWMMIVIGVALLLAWAVSFVQKLRIHFWSKRERERLDARDRDWTRTKCPRCQEVVPKWFMKLHAVDGISMRLESRCFRCWGQIDRLPGAEETPDQIWAAVEAHLSAQFGPDGAKAHVRMLRLAQGMEKNDD